jgi:hypothetical protein
VVTKRKLYIGSFALVEQIPMAKQLHPVEDLALPAGVKHFLAFSNKRTLGDLVALTDRELRKLRGIGKRTLAKIRHEVRRQGYVPGHEDLDLLRSRYVKHWGDGYPVFPGTDHATVVTGLGGSRDLCIDIGDKGISAAHYLTGVGVDLEEFVQCINKRKWDEHPMEVFDIQGKKSPVPEQTVLEVCEQLRALPDQKNVMVKWAVDDMGEVYFSEPRQLEKTIDLPCVQPKDILFVSDETNREIVEEGGRVVYLEKFALHRNQQITGDELTAGDRYRHIPDRLIARLSREGKIGDDDFVNNRLNSRFMKVLPLGHSSGGDFLVFDWGGAVGEDIGGSHYSQIVNYVPDNPYMLARGSSLSLSFDTRYIGRIKTVDTSEFTELEPGVWRSNFCVGYAVNRYRGMLYKLPVTKEEAQRDAVQKAFAKGLY